MKRPLFIAPLLTCIAYLLILSLPGNAQTGVTITGADAVQKFNTVLSSDLNTIIGQAKTRITTAYQSAIFRPPLVAPDQSRLDALNAALDRVLVDSSSALFRPKLIAPVAPVLNLLTQTANRVVASYAQNNLKAQLVYPKQLLNDQQAPTVSNIAVVTVEGKPGISWSSNEFARCTWVLRQGTQVLNESEESEFLMEHTQLLPNVPSDAELVAEVQCVDQSGNPSALSKLEFTLAPPVKRVYLPLITQR